MNKYFLETSFWILIFDILCPLTVNVLHGNVFSDPTDHYFSN